MVSEHLLTDEPEEVDDDPEEEIDHLVLAARSGDRASLDPKLTVDPRELAGNGWNSQKDRQLDLPFRGLEEKTEAQFKSLEGQMADF